MHQCWTHSGNHGNMLSVSLYQEKALTLFIVAIIPGTYRGESGSSLHRESKKTGLWVEKGS